MEIMLHEAIFDIVNLSWFALIKGSLILAKSIKSGENRSGPGDKGDKQDGIFNIA